MERATVQPRIQFPELLKIGFFVASSILVVAVFLFTHQMIQRLSREVATTSRVLARFCAQASLPATADPQLQQILSEVIANIDFPIVITDSEGTPRAWRYVGVDPASVPAASIDSVKNDAPIAPEIRERLARVEDHVKLLDRKNKPIPLIPSGSTASVGAVHYGEPEVLERLRWMPFLSVGGVVLLLGLGLWMLAIVRQAEKRIIWVGMAKETAHQLGTPLSSLMGWTDLLRAHADSAGSSDEVRIPAGELAEVVSEMDRDLARLRKVAERFSRVGSAPQLEPLDVTPVVRDVAEYMRKRLPREPGEVALREHYEGVPAVRLNSELMQWALENLITNAASALDKRPGVIEIAVGGGRDGRGVEISVSDNGRGMSPKEQRRAFEPGYTTRRRGWGLGLPLARRVVEDYHGGRLFVRHSVPGEGTTMVIRLPAV